jgi:hypothetical protein
MTEAAALRAFVATEISFNALRNALADSTDFAFLPSGTISVVSRRALTRTAFRPADVQRVLVRYQCGELTIGELSIWGVVLHALDSFDLEEVSEARKDEVWDMISQISVASISESFNATDVSNLLKNLGDIAEND